VFARNLKCIKYITAFHYTSTKYWSKLLRSQLWAAAISTALIDWPGFNVSTNTVQVIRATVFYRSKDPTNSILSKYWRNTKNTISTAPHLYVCLSVLCPAQTTCNLYQQSTAGDRITRPIAIYQQNAAYSFLPCQFVSLLFLHSAFTDKEFSFSDGILPGFSNTTCMHI